MPDYCMCRDTLCQLRHDCFRYRAVPNGWRQAYFMDTPAVDGFCEHFMDLEGWPDKMLRPEGEEITMTEAEEQEVDNARVAADLADAEAAQENMEVGPSTMKTAIALANEAKRSRTVSSVVLEKANHLATVAAIAKAVAEDAQQEAEKAVAEAESAVVSTQKITIMAVAAMARAKTDTDGVITEHMSPFMEGLGLDHVESLDVAADAARAEAAVILHHWSPWRDLLVPCCTFVKEVMYSTVWTVAVLGAAAVCLVAWPAVTLFKCWVNWIDDPFDKPLDD